MKAILLAAGAGNVSLDDRESRPKCLTPYGGATTVLDAMREALKTNGVKDVCRVGGFEILKIMQACPGVRYYYNDGWTMTGSGELWCVGQLGSL